MRHIFSFQTLRSINPTAPTQRFYSLLQTLGLLLMGLFLLTTGIAQAQVSGTVFRDFDGNGQRDGNLILPAQEPLIPGVIVNVYTTTGVLCGSAVTAGSTAPNYTVTGCGTGDVRVEFTLPGSGMVVNSAVDYPALNGSAYGSSVQFVKGNATNVNFAISNPADYNEGSLQTDVFVPCYQQGDPLPALGVGALDWFVGYPHVATGAALTTKHLNGQRIGATWGVAYSKQAKKIFTSAMMKRHVGLGTLGSGGIYIVDEATFAASNFYDLDANGYRTRAGSGAPAYGSGNSFDFFPGLLSPIKTRTDFKGANDPVSGQPIGLGVIGTNSQRGLLPTPGLPSFDPAAFDQVGKVSLGDLEISDDGKYLFVMNLYSRKLIRMTLNSASNPTSVVAVTEYSLPNVAVTNGLLRPWALKFHRSKLYVGAVSSGENEGENNVPGGTTDLNAYIFEMNNPTGAASFNATPVLTYPLNFIKGPAATASLDLPPKWHPWSRNTANFFPAALNIVYPQPVLSDIEFSDRGDMIIGFSDRAGHQWGNANYQNLSGPLGVDVLTIVAVGGDIQIAGLDAATNTFILENAGKFKSINGETYPPLSLPGTNLNGQGPGGGEFFYLEAFPPVASVHAETAQGGLAVLKGDGNVMLTVIDPLVPLSGGTTKFSTSNALVSSPYTLYIGTLGKANGLGDLELSGVESPIEVGNRVWNDINGNGLQDANEPGLNGLTVQLLNGSTVVASTTTANGGQYYFNSTSTTALQPNTAYTLKLAGTLGTGPLSAFTAYSPLNPALAGNDANAAGVVSLTTGGVGATAHTYDIGLVAAVLPCSLTITSVTPGTCDPTTNLYTATGTVTLTNAPAGVLTVQDGLVSTTVSVAANQATATFTLSGLLSNGSSHTVTASLPGCSVGAPRTYTAPVSCLTTAAACTNGLGGIVFNDFANTGVKSATTTLSGIPGVTVTVFNCQGALLGTTTTDFNGRYSFTATPFSTAANYPLRVEFSNLPAWARATANGTNGRTDIQFVTAPNCTIDFGATSLSDYCQAVPAVTIPCYENGLRTSNNNPAIVSFPYNSTGTGGKTTAATISQVGATWGTAYQSATKRLFAGTLLKRHVDLGGAGIGGVYVLTYPAAGGTPAITNFTLQGVTPAVGPVIDLGTINRTAANSGLAASNFTLSANSTTPNIDLDAYLRAGNTSFGDVDLDETGKSLWLVNLNQRSLISVDVSGTTLPGAVSHYAFETLPGFPTCPVYTNTGTTTIRINVNGPAFTDADGNNFIADQYGTGGNLFNQTGDNLTNLNNPYEATNASQDFYRTLRSGPSFSYAIPVTSGRYKVVLHTYDPSSTTAGARVFDVTAEGKDALTNFDHFTARDDAADRATTNQFVTDVTDGTLNLAFASSAGNAVVSSIEVIPVASGTSGVGRPWGLAFNKGKGYVGIVCDASNSLRRADLQASVMSFDPNNVTAGLTPVLSFPLNFTRENTNGVNQPGHWTAWRSAITMNGDVADPSYRRFSPQPLLSDIEFTENGSMVLGFLDRSGNQEGFANYRPYAGTSLLNGSGIRTAGDVVQACYVNGQFVLEQGNNGTVCKCNDPGGSASNQLTNDGPSNAGEYYFDDYYSVLGRGTHLEVATGGLAQRKGSNEILTSVYDPTTNAANEGLFSQGIHWYNVRTGGFTRTFNIVEFTGNVGAFPYDPTTFGKANGLGDPSLLCNPLPLEIGNRVWIDKNQNGVQDPCADEPGVAGVRVNLYDNTGRLVGKTTTNASGEYYFNPTNVATQGVNATTGAPLSGTFTGPAPLSQYCLVFGNDGATPQFNATTGAFSLSGTSYQLTAANSTASNGNDQNDSDATIASGNPTTAANGFPTICLTTPDAGANHTFDVGLTVCSLTATASASSQTVCAGQPVTLTARVSPVGSYTYAWSGPAGVSITPTNAATVTATNLVTGVNTFTVTVSSSPSCQTTATVSVTVVAPPVVTLTSAVVCAGQPVSLTASGAGTGATYVFSVSGATGNVLTVTPTATTVYTVTATTSGGCSATATGTVTVNPLPNAGPDQLLVCGPLGQTPTSTTLTGTPAGGLWSNASGNPTVATFTPNAGSGMTTAGNLVSGTYMFTYTVNGCVDAVMVTVPVCQTFCATITATATASSNTLTPGQSVTLTAQVSPAGSYTYAWSGPGTITPTNASAVTTSGLSNGVNTFTVTVTSSPGCFTTATVSVTVLTPALSVSVGTPVCNTLTNNYTASGTVSLTNAQAGSLTITDNGTTIATIPVTTGQTSATFQATGVSGSSPASHSVVASLGTTTASTTYATPASCTVCSLSLTTTALNNGQVGTAYSQTLTTANGTAPLTFSLTGSLPTGLTLNAATGVIAGTPTSAATASFTVRVSDAKACTAVAPLTITVGDAPVCSLTATVTPTACNTATNQYSITGTISATNTPVNQSLTVAVGSNSVLVALNGNGPVSFTMTGLESDGLTKTLTVTSSATACGMTSQTFTAPASCTVGLALSVTPGVCNTVTNGYGITGTLSLTNAVAGIATISDGTSSTTVTVNAGDAAVPYSLTDLPSGSGNRIVTVNYAGKVASVTYTAPESCTVAPALSVVVTPGVCNTANNQYDLTGTISLTAAVASTLTISDGSSSTVVSVTAGQTSASFALTGLTSGTGNRIVTVSGTGYAPVSATYNAPESCTVCSLSITATALANGQVGTAYSQTLTTANGTAPLTFGLVGSLPVGLGLNTATGVISGTPTSATTNSFTISVTDGKSCTAVAPLTIVTSAAPVCSLTATATPGTCNTATNQYAVTGTISATNTQANQSLTVSVGANSSVVTLIGNGPVSFTLAGLTSDGLVKTLTVLSSATACGTASTTYTAPASCTVITCVLPTNLMANTSCLSNTNGSGQIAATATGTGATGNDVEYRVYPTGGTGGAYGSSGVFAGLTNGLYVVEARLVGTTAPGCSVTTTASINCSCVAPTLTVLSPSTTVCAPATFDLTSTSIITQNTGVRTLYYTSLAAANVGGSAGALSNPQAITASGTYYIRSETADMTCFVVKPFSVTIVNCNTGSIGDLVWKDNNNNGQFDLNEPPVAGVTVELFTVTNGVLSTTSTATTVTSASGLYAFTGLPSGDYRVKFTVPASLTGACQLTTKPLSGTDRTRDSDADPVTGLTPVITIDVTQPVSSTARNNPTIDAGLQRRIYDPVGYIYCYRDGTILKGGTISVSGPGSISITQDGSQGYYQFFTDGTPGSYTLSYNNPSTFGIATGVRPPAGASIDPTDLEGTPADKDGELNGWVSLGSQPNSTTTALVDASAAANPYYLVFNVVGGDPYVSENNLPIECTPPLGSIGSVVFNDLNQNGQQDPTEPGVDNVTVRLLEQTAPNTFTLVSTMATAGGGSYLFPNLPAGTYVVEFVKSTLPANFVFTTANAPNVPDDTNSDADPTTGRTAPITLVPTDPAQRNALAINAGIVNAGCPPAKCLPIAIRKIR